MIPEGLPGSSRLSGPVRTAVSIIPPPSCWGGPTGMIVMVDLDGFTDELGRFATVVAAVERRDLPASDYDSMSAHRQWDRWWARNMEQNRDDLPPHVVACIGLGAQLGQVLTSDAVRLPTALRAQLKDFAGGVGAVVDIYRAGVVGATEPLNESLARAGEVGQKAKRLQPQVAQAVGNLARPEHGPVPPNLFYSNGEPFELPPRIWRLIDYMWNRDRASLEEVEDAVWGEEMMGEKTVASTVSRANRRLQEIGCPMLLTIKQGYLLKS